MKHLTTLESEALKMLLDGDDATLRNLRPQLDSISIKNREMTGTGFYTNFLVQKLHKGRIVSNRSEYKFGDVHADIEGLHFGAGFLLFVKGGEIEMLEAFTYDEPWPDLVKNFKLSYINVPRDFEKLRAVWLEN